MNHSKTSIVILHAKLSDVYLLVFLRKLSKTIGKRRRRRKTNKWLLVEKTQHFGGKGINFPIRFEISALYKKMSFVSKDVDDK